MPGDASRSMQRTLLDLCPAAFPNLGRLRSSKKIASFSEAVGGPARTATGCRGRASRTPVSAGLGATTDETPESNQRVNGST